MGASRAYEQLVRDLYQSLVDQSDVSNVAVRHDVKIRGLSGEVHQIDVFWEFEIAGVRHRTCIECRHYTGKIKKTQVAAFSRILADLDGAKGIMVTTVGFQSGAVGLARTDGIRLMQVAPLVQEIHVNITVRGGEVSGWLPVFNQASASMLRAKNGGRPVQIHYGGAEDEIFLLNGDGSNAVSLYDLKGRILASDCPAGQHREPLDDKYLRTASGLVKVDAIDCMVSRNVTSLPPVVIGGRYVARAIVRELAEGGAERFFHTDGTLRDSSRRELEDEGDPA